VTGLRPRPAGDHPGRMPDTAAARALRFLRRDILAMAGYTPGEQVLDCIKLNTNEPPWEPSPAVLDALRGVVPERLRLYPSPRADRLREAAALRFGVQPGQVMAGNGSDDCLTVVYRAILAAGDRVACPWPSYGLYDTLAAIQGAEMVHVDYRIGARSWDLPEALPLVGAKLVLVANPNNPSATLTPPDELRRLADRLDGILVVDEAYTDFAPAGSSLLPVLDQHPNLVVLRTFSKSYSLAGGRLGLLFAAEPLVEQFMKVKDSYNVNHLTQVAGIAALGDEAGFASAIRRTLVERDRLLAGLAAFGWTWPDTAGNFVLVQVGPRAGELYRALKSRGILVRWWDRPVLADKLRITVGRPEHTDRLLAALKDLV
jgi:histidinol-phosphate aminotransferase